MEGVKKASPIIFIVLGTISFVLAVIASALPNWSHLNASHLNSTLGELINFGPWRVCTKILNENYRNLKCANLDASYVIKSDSTFQIVLFSLTSSQWSQVQAVRALTVISLVFSAAFLVFVILAMVLPRWKNMLETVAFKGQFLVGLLGFIVTCIWANFGERDGYRYGASFICHLTSWLVAIAAGLAGVWGRGEGVPEVVSRFATPAVASLVWVLSIISTALADWGHGEASQLYLKVVPFLADVTYGLWKFCAEDASSNVQQSSCFKYGRSVDVPYVGTGGIHFQHTVDFSAKDLSLLKGCQALSILAILSSTLAFVGVVYGRVRNNQSHILYRLRIPAAGLTFLWSFILMCVFSSFINSRSMPDLGSAFGVNCVVWVVALLWVVQHIRGGGSSHSGGGYAVTTGDGSTPYASV